MTRLDATRVMLAGTVLNGLMSRQVFGVSSVDNARAAVQAADELLTQLAATPTPAELAPAPTPELAPEPAPAAEPGPVEPAPPQS